MWVRVRPSLVPTLLEDIPLPEREILGQAARSFTSLGFLPMANGHCPDFSWLGKWTQALFVNRALGERASVIILREAVTANVTVAFASEAPNRPQITTAAKCRINKQNAAPDVPLPNVEALLEQHRRAVREAGIRPEQCLLPRPENAFEWLSQRATSVASSVAEQMRMVQQGDLYRWTWWRAGLQTWPRLWPVKGVIGAWRNLRKRLRREDKNNSQGQNPQVWN